MTKTTLNGLERVSAGEVRMLGAQHRAMVRTMAVMEAFAAKMASLADMPEDAAQLEMMRVEMQGRRLRLQNPEVMRSRLAAVPEVARC